MRARGKYNKIMNMSLVENLINQISTQGLGGITSPLGYNLNDDTFSKLLEKQLNSTNDMLTNNFVGFDFTAFSIACCKSTNVFIIITP